MNYSVTQTLLICRERRERETFEEFGEVEEVSVRMNDVKVKF